MEQRVNFKFLVKLGKTTIEAFIMLKEVHGNDCSSECLNNITGLKRSIKRPKTICVLENL